MYNCSMETVQHNGRFTFFLVNSPLTYILFSMGPHPLLYAKLKWVLPAFPTPSQSQAENRKYYISNQFQNLKY